MRAYSKIIPATILLSLIACGLVAADYLPPMKIYLEKCGI
jgi:hypothetical protein